MYPDKDTFRRYHEQGKTQLVHAKIAGDLDTPVGAYIKLCTGKESYSFLLESIEGGAMLGRYSVIGYAPDIIWKADEHKAPIQSLRDLLKACRIDLAPEDLPPMAVSGLFGYMGYGMVRHIENIPADNPDTLDIETSILMRPQVLVIFDNVYNEIYIVAPVYDTELEAGEAYEKACIHIQTAMERLSDGLPHALDTAKTTSSISLPLEVRADISREDFKAMVEKAKEHILAGDIFQVVLSRRFEADYDLPALDFYRALRMLNPSPFMFLLAFEDFTLVGSSPEILVRVRDGKATIRPIAGTRKRGTNAAEDAALAQDLLADPKERAEHLMLLDLGRNDIGRIATYGSVKVTEQFAIELYSHVMHIVSNVEGDLRKDLDIIDAHFSGFPAGTVSGAPKIRAMEIIDDLEPVERSYYGGSIGYFSGNGETDTCIALRTALIKDGKIYVQAGAGIVADSDPDSEYEETINKAKALLNAAEQAIKRSQSA